MSLEKLPINAAGAEKAAVLMLALNNGQSVNLMARMKDTEIREISEAMTRLGLMKAAAVETVLSEFVGRSPQPELAAPSLMGTGASPAAPAGAALSIMLSGIDDQRLARFLESEYPQTIAMVLSKLPRSRSAK